MQNAIIAPVDGAIVEVDAKVSTVTSAQNYSSTNAIVLVDTSYVRFTGLVDEIDIMKVSQGQPATITVDAIPNKTFTGKVQFISPFGALSGSVVKFTVFIALDPIRRDPQGRPDRHGNDHRSQREKCPAGAGIGNPYHPQRVHGNGP